jgi:hypothetical protein
MHETQANCISHIDPRAAMVAGATCHPLGTAFFHSVWIYDLMQYQICVLDARRSMWQPRSHFECGWLAVTNRVHQRYVWLSVDSIDHNRGAHTTQLHVARSFDIWIYCYKLWSAVNKFSYTRLYRPSVSFIYINNFVGVFIGNYFDNLRPLGHTLT